MFFFFREKTKTALLETITESAKRFLQAKEAKVQSADLLKNMYTLWRINFDIIAKKETFAHI